MTKLLWTSALASVISAVAMVPASKAQDAGGAATPQAGSAMEEVLVTARRRTENIQTVPVAVTALTQSQLNKTGSFNLTDLSQSVPSLNFNNQVGTRSDIIPSLRGQSVVFGGRYPATIVYFADVPILKITKGQFYDLDSIQVLRGPQGTLFGRVTDGGNIMLAPKKPTNEFGGYVEGTGGNYGLHHFTGAINVPIIKDKLMVRGAFDINRRKGFTKNLLPGYGGKDLDNVHYDSFRGSVLFKPTDNLENLTIYSYNQADESGFGNQVAVVNEPFISSVISGTAQSFGFPAATADAFGAAQAASMSAALAAQRANGIRTTSIGSLAFGPDAGQFNHRQDTYVINTTTWHVNDNLQLKNILGYVRIKNHWGADYDGTPALYVDTENVLLPHPEFNLEQYSEEFQVQGKIGEKLDFTVGTYWDFAHTGGPSENQTVNIIIVYRANQATQQSQSKAVYAQFGYDLSDILEGLKLDAGIRYTDDRSKSTSGGIIGLWDPTGAFGAGVFNLDSFPHGTCPDACAAYKQSAQAMTYTLGLNYKVTDRTFVYGKVSRGYRPGGANSSPLPGQNPNFDPEYVVSMEFGGKTDYDIGPVQLRTNAAVFRDRYTKIQKLVSFTSGGVPYSFVTNAANAHIWGVELEQTIVPFAGMNIHAAYSHLEAKYDQPSQAVVNAACFAPYQGFCTLSPFQGAPKNTITVDAHYTLPLSEDIGDVTFGGSWYHRGYMAMGDNSFLDPYLYTPGYDLLSFDASWNRVFNSPVDVKFFMTNATNKEYLTGVNSLENNLGIATQQFGEPRMWGFTLRYNFGPQS